MNFEDYENKFPYASILKDKSAYTKYRDEERLLYAKFKNDLFDDLGIQNNPKKEKLFSLAWSMGHAAGYSEVHGYACELVVLIKD